MARSMAHKPCAGGMAHKPWAGCLAHKTLAWLPGSQILGWVPGAESPARRDSEPMNGRAAYLELLIDVGSDPIRGTVVVGAGAPQPFCGWMELTEAIEAARERRDPDLASDSAPAKA